MHPGKLALLSTVLTLALPLVSQPPDTSPQPAGNPTPTIQVYSRETTVDIIVTDDKGAPVSGLQQSDFTIKEDGKPQPIRSFQQFGFGARPRIRRLPNLPDNVRTNYQLTPTHGPVNIILLDALHMNFASAARAIQATSAYIERMPPGTQVALFWLSESGLHMLQGFTSDPPLLLQTLQTTRTDIGSNQDCHWLTWTTTDALKQIAEYVGGISGRKNLIWLTTGMPVYLLRDGGYSWGATAPCRDLVLARPRQSTASRSYNMPDYMYQPHSNDGTPAQFYSIEQHQQEALAGVATYGAVPGPRPFDGTTGSSSDGLDMALVHRLMDTYELFTENQIAVSPVDVTGVASLGMQQLVAEQVAEQSGGIATYDRNDLATAVGQTIAESGQYYTLSYATPRLKQDGHYHTISVELHRPDLHLVYRKGYNDEDPKQVDRYAGEALIKAALQGRVPAATGLFFAAKLARSASDQNSTVPAAALAAPANAPIKPLKRRTPPPRTPYDLTVAVPQSQITYGTAEAGAHTVRLRFAFEAYDLNGKHLGGHSQNVSLDLTPDRYEAFLKNPVLFHEKIWFYSGPLFLRVGVLDQNSNLVGTLEFPLTVPKLPHP